MTDQCLTIAKSSPHKFQTLVPVCEHNQTGCVSRTETFEGQVAVFHP